MGRRKDEEIPPEFQRTSSHPLPCLQDSHYLEILKQGKGTDDHLSFVGDWFPLAGILHLVTKWLAYMAWIKIASGIQNQVADIVADVVVFNDN